MKKTIGFLLFLFLLVVSSCVVCNQSFAISDNKGPTISDFRIEESGQTLTVGDYIHASVKIEDESGVASGNVILENGNNVIRFDFVYNEQTGRWEDTYRLQETDKDGTYTSKEVVAYDIHHNQSVSWDSRGVSISFITNMGIPTPDMILPSGLIHISSEAFTNTNFTCVQLPEKLESIEANAFFQCENLESVIVLNKNAAIDGNAFGGKIVTVYGYHGSTAEIWSEIHCCPFVAIK